MTERKRHEHAAWIAALVLGGGIVAEGMRLVLLRPWRGYAFGISLFVSAVLALTWSGVLTTLLLRRRFRGAATTAWIATFLAPITMLAHAAATRVGGNGLGLLYVPAALVLVVALKRVFDRGEIVALEERGPDGEHLRRSSS
jgi:hypothetical protein